MASNTKGDPWAAIYVLVMRKIAFSSLKKKQVVQATLIPPQMISCSGNLLSVARPNIFPSIPSTWAGYQRFPQTMGNIQKALKSRIAFATQEIRSKIVVEGISTLFTKDVWCCIYVHTTTYSTCSEWMKEFDCARRLLGDQAQKKTWLRITHSSTFNMPVPHFLKKKELGIVKHQPRKIERRQTCVWLLRVSIRLVISAS